MKTPEEIADDAMGAFTFIDYENDDDNDVVEQDYYYIKDQIVAAIEADRAQRGTRVIHVVFDGPPEHEVGRFVEVETPDGKGVKVGEWVQRPDGYWALEVEVCSE